MLLLGDPIRPTTRERAAKTVERRRIAPVQPSVMRQRTALAAAHGGKALLEPDLHAAQDAVVGIGVERQVRGDDIALQLQDERDVLADLEALRQAEPPAPV